MTFLSNPTPGRPFGSEPGEGVIAFGWPCFMCGRPFSFHPDLVPSILIDPVTGQSPETGGDPDRALREPLCRPCVDKINAAKPGHIRVLPGAYPGE